MSSMTKFRLSHGGHDKLDDPGNCEDCPTESGDMIIFGEKDVRYHVATTFAEVDEGGIHVGSGDHVAGLIGDAIVCIGSNIIEKLVNGQKCGFGLGCLFDANRADADHELVVHIRRIKEEGTNDALDALDTGIIEWKTGFSFSVVLGLGAILDFGVSVWWELAFLGFRVMLATKDHLDVARY